MMQSTPMRTAVLAATDQTATGMSSILECLEGCTQLDVTNQEASDLTKAVAEMLNAFLKFARNTEGWKDDIPKHEPVFDQ